MLNQLKMFNISRELSCHSKLTKNNEASNHGPMVNEQKKIHVHNATINPNELLCKTCPWAVNLTYIIHTNGRE